MNEIQAEKLDRFVNSVNNEVDEKINKIISEAEIQKSHQVKKTEDEELLNAYNKIQRSVRVSNRSTAEGCSKTAAAEN